MIHSFYANTEEEHTYLAFHRHFMSGMEVLAITANNPALVPGLLELFCCLG